MDIWDHGGLGGFIRGFAPEGGGTETDADKCMKGRTGAASVPRHRRPWSRRFAYPFIGMIGIDKYRGAVGRDASERDRGPTAGLARVEVEKPLKVRE